MSMGFCQDQGEHGGAIAVALQELDAVVATELGRLAESQRILQEENSRLREHLFRSVHGSVSSISESVGGEETCSIMVGTDEITDQYSIQLPNRSMPSTFIPQSKLAVEGEELIPNEGCGMWVTSNASNRAMNHRNLCSSHHVVPENVRASAVSAATFTALLQATPTQCVDIDSGRSIEREPSELSAGPKTSIDSRLSPSARSTMELPLGPVASLDSNLSMVAMDSSRRPSSPKKIFQLLPTFDSDDEQWDVKRSTSRIRVSTTDHSFKKAVFKLNEGSQGKYERTGCTEKLQPYLISPMSVGSIAIDVLAIAMILYDCVVVPILLLQDAESSIPSAITFMFWVSRIFWTLAIPRTFFTCYMKKDGSIEKNALHIAKKYCQTWLIFDVSVVIADWLDSKSGGVVRIIRLLKAARLARMFRIPHTLIKQFNYANAERMLLWFSILGSVFTFILVNHFLACLWFWVGTQGNSHGWVPELGLEDASIVNKYTYSVHWSTSQFIGSTEVMPKSKLERAFGAIVMLFAFIWSASFISNITAAITRLQLLSGQKAKKISTLQHFLANNRISGQLAMRALTSATFLLAESDKNLPEADVELLHMLSQPMRNEIHYAMHSRHLMEHPFFWHYNVHEPLALQKLCHSAISIIRVGNGDVLFTQGEQPTDPHMFFVLNGTLLYIKDFNGDGNVDPDEMKKVTSSMWLCEPVLWVKWTHLGNLRSATYCSLLALGAEKFRRVIAQFVTTPYPTQYATQLVEMLNLAMEIDLEHNRGVDDLLSGVDVLAIVSQVFPPESGRDVLTPRSIFREKSKSFSRSLSNLGFI